MLGVLVVVPKVVCGGGFGCWVAATRSVGGADRRGLLAVARWGVSDIYIFFSSGSLECLGVGECYGLIWLVVERLGMVDIGCVGMVVVVGLAQDGVARSWITQL